MYTIDASRTYDWASYCGIPGGIPNRTTVYQTMTTANTITQINAAIAACPVGQVVALAAGTYSISGISRKSGITVRGAGAGQTIISSGASIAFNYAGSSFNYDSGHQAIASGYTKGSLSITMATTPGAQFVVGRLIMINQDDDHTLVFPRTGNWAGTRNLRHVSRITDITGNVITFSTPLPYTYVAGQNPGAQAIPCSDSLFGVENMTIDASSGVRFLGADRCWVKNCEIRGFDNEAIFCRDSHQLEIRRCYLHDCDGFPTQADGYGLYAQYAVSNLLMEDCIGYHIAYGTVMNGNDSSAYLYNYMLHMGRDAATRFWQQPGFNCNHGPHSIMNLWEGNMAERWQNDAYHGSASHQTLFRNHIHGVNPAYTLDRRIMDFCRTSYYFNTVGNIIGDSSWTPNYYEYPATAYDRTHGTMFLLGWPNMGSGSLTEETTLTGFTPPGGSYPDTNVATTLIRHGNYDHYNDSQYEWADADHDIADSLFYSSKPSYFGALTWPPIDPVTPTAGSIPAKSRWDAYVISSDLDDLFTSNTYWVSPTGAATWANARSESALTGTACCSIATAIANAASGDTIYLRAGTYTQTISPTNSGTTGNPITWSAYNSELVVFTVTTNFRWGINLQGKSYHKFIGLKFTGCDALFVLGWGSSYNEFDNCWFELDNAVLYQSGEITGWNSAGSLLASGGSSHNWFHDCTFTKYGAIASANDLGTIRIGRGYTDETSNNTFEDCDFSYGGHDCLSINGRYNVIRDCTFHNEEAYFVDPGDCANSPYSDGFFGNRCLLLECGNTDNSGVTINYAGTARDTLIETNRIGHSGMSPDDNGAHCIETAGIHSLIRHNYIYAAAGTGIYFKAQPYPGATPAAGSTLLKSGSDSRVINNTIYKTGVTTHTGTIGNGLSITRSGFQAIGYANTAFGNWPDNVVIKNNINYDWDGGSEIGYPISPRLYDITYTNNFTADPSFVNTDITDATSLVLPDLSLGSGSPCIGAGLHLTNANGGGTATTTLVVDDALYFQDGTWGSSLSGVVADWIAIGTTTNTVEISSINYATKTITLATAATWADNAPVWLYKNSRGTIVLLGDNPDIGAHESRDENPGFSNPFKASVIVSANDVARLYVEYPHKRVKIGAAATYEVHVEAYGSFAANVTLDATGLPTNATDSYGTNPIAYNGTTTATIATTGVAAGTYSIYFTGTAAGGEVGSVRVILEVVASDDCAPKVPVRRIRVKQGGSAVFTVQADPTAGYTGNMDLTATGVPTGASGAFGAATIGYTGSTTYTVSAGTAAVGTHEITITGEGPA